MEGKHWFMARMCILSGGLRAPHTSISEFLSVDHGGYHVACRPDWRSSSKEMETEKLAHSNALSHVTIGRNDVLGQMLELKAFASRNFGDCRFSAYSSDYLTLLEK